MSQEQVQNSREIQERTQLMLDSRSITLESVFKGTKKPMYSTESKVHPRLIHSRTFDTTLSSMARTAVEHPFALVEFERNGISKDVLAGNTVTATNKTKKFINT